MRRLKLLVLVICVACVPSTVVAFTPVGPSGLPTANDFASTLLPELRGVVSWQTLAKVEHVKRGNKMVAQFSDDILALDNQPVRIVGFMMPLDMTDRQRHFLLAAVPGSCPFCMPAGPEAIVEVMSKQPIKFGFEPIIMSGKLSLLKNDPSGVLYQMTDAESLALPPN